MARKKQMTAQEMGKKGGTQRAKNLTKQQRSESARKAVLARWAKKSAKGDK
jgi:hypothetical protein